MRPKLPLLVVFLLMGSASAGVFAPLFRDLAIKPFFNLVIYLIPEWSFAINQGCAFAYHYKDLLQHNPDPDLIGGSFMRILSNLLVPVLILLLVLTAFYLLFFSASPQQRARAKLLFAKLLAVIIFLAFPIPVLIIKALFGVSESLTQEVLGYAPKEEVEKLYCETILALWNVSAWLGTPDPELSLVPIVLMWLLAWLPHMILGLRSILLVVLAALFPLAVLCYLFNVFGTRQVGRFLLEQLLVWTFVQVLMAVVVVVSAELASIYIARGVDELPYALHEARRVPLNILWVLFLLVCELLSIPCLVLTVLTGDVVLLGDIFILFRVVLYTSLFGIASYAALTLVPIVAVLTFRRFLP